MTVSKGNKISQSDFSSLMNGTFVLNHLTNLETSLVSSLYKLRNVYVPYTFTVVNGLITGYVAGSTTYGTYRDAGCYVCTSDCSGYCSGYNPCGP